MDIEFREQEITEERESDICIISKKVTFSLRWLYKERSTMEERK